MAEPTVETDAIEQAFIDAVMDTVVSQEVGDLNLRVRDVVAIARWLAPVHRSIVASESTGPGWFWTQDEWAEWSNDLARLIPEDDVSEYSNPEGAQEGIISDCLAAYIAEREVG